MRSTDPQIETVACGSSSILMPSFADWDARVIESMGDEADFISVHGYVGNWTQDTRDFLAITNTIDRQIETIDAVARAVQAKRKSNKRVYLSFDEWNVWYKTQELSIGGNRAHGAFPAHLIEEIYNLEDALVVAGFLHSFLRHADCVKVANLAQIVNVIAPILTRGDDLLIQSIFHPIEMFTKRGRGVSLRTAVDGPSYRSDTYGEVDEIDCSALLDGNRLHVFATNRSLDEQAAVTVALGDRRIARNGDAEVVTGPDAKAENSFEHPDVIRSVPLDGVTADGNRARFTLPPLSFAALTFELE
jgi:alpha-N-arabinofuranosidase